MTQTKSAVQLAKELNIELSQEQIEISNENLVAELQSSGKALVVIEGSGRRY